MSDIHKIISLHHENFAGSESEDIIFNEGITRIMGQNGVGKSRYEKALKWLLFGKNAQDKSDFSIKNTKDTSKNREDTIVSCVWNKNGNEIAIKRVFRERWEKKQGTNDYFYKGNTTEYFFDSKNDIGMNAFNEKIKELIAPDIFKAVTSVTYFANLGWEDQRKMLFRLIPEASDENIASGNKDFEGLLASLKNGKTLAEYHKDVKKGISDLSDRIKLIAPVIKELKSGMPTDEGFSEIEAELNKYKGELSEVEGQINSQLQQENVKNQAKVKIQQEVNSLKSERQQLEYNIQAAETAAANSLTTKKQNCRVEIDREESLLKLAEATLVALKDILPDTEENLKKIGAEWDEVNASTYQVQDGDFTCSKCGAEMSGEAYEAKKDELKKSFIELRDKSLQQLNEKGRAAKKSLEDAKKGITDGEQIIKEKTAKIAELKAEFLELNKQETPKTDTLSPENKRITDIILEIAAKEDKLNADEPTDQSELILKKTHISESIEFLITKLAKKDEREKDLLRIEELKKQESDLGQEQAGLEKTDFIIKKFEAARVEAAEGPLNSKFKFVTFKLFNVALDGTQSATCVPLVDSVPWKDANTSGQIIAGLDIIDALSNIYGVRAPVWVDQKESVTSELICNSQLITMEAIEGLPLTIK